MDAPPSPEPTLSLRHGRLLIVAAAVLWSLSGAFTKLLTRPTILGLHEPELPSLVIAFARVLFAGLVLVPTLRRQDFTFRPAMLGMIASFAIMNALFVRAMAEGTAANAILLQYTAPMWMYVASVFWLREPADARGPLTLLFGLVGIAAIVWGGWQGAQMPVIALGLGSGLTYAGVVIGLRVLRAESPRWLTVLNHLGGALALLPFVVALAPPRPTLGQLAFLALFGTVQTALPYWLMARGLRVVNPQEAGAITLLEPLLNPLWAYLVAPETETPSAYTLLGGAFIVGGLAYRYWPRKTLTPT
jgi:drug/metabolite transporter (DMT)-like permease